MISIKKLGTVAAASALFASAALPAVAYGGDHHRRSGGELKIEQENEANVENMVMAASNTGSNTGGKIVTGNAGTEVLVGNWVNSNMASADTCGCRGEAELEQENEAEVGNGIFALSNTGANSAGSEATNLGGRHHHHHQQTPQSSVETGDAWTGVAVSNFVNSNVAMVGGGSIED